MSLDKGVNPRLLGIETRDHSHPGSLRRSDNVTDGVPTGTKGSTKGLEPHEGLLPSGLRGAVADA